MPRKEEKVYCVNHPTVEMMVLNEGNPNSFHTMRLATLEHGKRYQIENKSTGFEVFACKECGYCEVYLTASERTLLNETKK